MNKYVVLFATYTYDDDNRQIEKNINSQVTRYFYDGDSIHLLYETDGSEYCKFYAGEGIQDCQVDVNQDIWISYSDEGIFGESPIGANGIVAFDPTGKLIFNNYDQYVERFNVPPIDDCYAMNVIDGDVWLYYYSEFPLVQMKDKNFHMLWNEINLTMEIWSESFAVVQDKVVFITRDKKLVVYDLNNNHVYDINPCNATDSCSLYYKYTREY